MERLVSYVNFSKEVGKLGILSISVLLVEQYNVRLVKTLYKDVRQCPNYSVHKTLPHRSYTKVIILENF